MLADAEARTYWSADDIAAFRDRLLSRFVQHCAATVPFYRDRFAAAGIRPGDVKSVDDLRLLPILERREAQEHASEFVSSAVPERKTRIVHTSGTTGGALRFPVSLRATREQWATWWRYRAWHGIRRGTWCGLFAGRSVVPAWQGEPPFWRLNYPGRQILFSGYHMSEQNLATYVQTLRERQPPWLHGYPSLLALLAGHIVERRSDLGYPVRWVTVGAENLLPHQSELIERAFGVKPLQHYGLAEGVANISQCEQGALHVDEDYAAVEFVPVGPDRLYRVIGTNITNPAAPLVRYDTQDIVTISKEASCSCNRPGRVIESIDGRHEDYVALPNGTRLGRMDHIFKDMVNIKEAQIHQAHPDEITLRVVRGHKYNDFDEDALRRETIKRVGNEMDVRVEYVDSLPRSANGKLRFVVSEIKEASIDRLSHPAGFPAGDV
jgi:phenylacetate-CoA ligase